MHRESAAPLTPELTFEFTLDVDEQVRAAGLLDRRSRGGQLFRWVGIPFLLAFPVVLALAFDAPLAVLRPWMLLIAAVAVAALSVRPLQRWQTRRALAATPGLRSLRYQFDEQGFTLTTSLSSLHLSWDTVQEAIETDDMFVLFVVGGVAYYVPKRATGGRGPALAQLLRARLGPRAAKVRGPNTH